MSCPPARVNKEKSWLWRIEELDGAFTIEVAEIYSGMFSFRLVTFVSLATLGFRSLVEGCSVRNFGR